MINSSKHRSPDNGSFWILSPSNNRSLTEKTFGEDVGESPVFLLESLAPHLLYPNTYLLFGAHF
jgi:hypothetical protein